MVLTNMNDKSKVRLWNKSWFNLLLAAKKKKLEDSQVFMVTRQMRKQDKNGIGYTATVNWPEFRMVNINAILKEIQQQVGITDEQLNAAIEHEESINGLNNMPDAEKAKAYTKIAVI